MPKYDVYQAPKEPFLVLDVQADLLDGLNTRMVVPLMPLEQAPTPAQRLNPIFEIKGEPYMMATQFMAALPLLHLKNPITNMQNQADTITQALDMLFQGF